MKKWPSALLLLTLSLSAAAARAAGFASLTAELQASTTHYLLGEPVPLTIRVVNNTASPIYFENTLDPGMGFTSLQAAREGEDFRPYSAPGWGMKDSPVLLTNLMPGEERMVSVTILFNASSPDYEFFASSGIYHVKAELRGVNPPALLQTPLFALALNQPEGVEAAAWNRLHNRDAYWFLQTYWTDKPSVVAAFDQFLLDFPGSRYAPHVTQALALYRLAGGR